MEEYITQFINSILPEVEVIFEDNEFWVDVKNKTINIGVNPDPIGEELIQEFVFNEFGVAMDSFLIGVLHEIGHIMTYDKEIFFEGQQMYMILNMLNTGNGRRLSIKDRQNIYFNIPNEYRATEWAVNYYLTFQEECDEFMDMIR